MNKILDKLYALRTQMSAADLPLDAIDEKIRIEEEKESSWKKDLEDISSTMKTFIQPIVKKGGDETVTFHAKYKSAELSSLVLNRDGKDIVLYQDPENEVSPITSTKHMKQALMVSFPDGVEVFEPQTSVTLGKAITLIGAERVASLQMRGLISRDPNDFKSSQFAGKGYYVNTYSNTNTKRRQLEEISRLLDLGLVVKVVPGVYKSRKSRFGSIPQRPSPVAIQQLMEELEKRVLGISPEFSVNKDLKSYWQFLYNSSYAANAIPRKKLIRVMLNDEYDQLKGMPGIIEAPNAHYGHVNRCINVSSNDDIAIAVEYITKMIRLPNFSGSPKKIRIRLDKASVK